MTFQKHYVNPACSYLCDDVTFDESGQLDSNNDCSTATDFFRTYSPAPRQHFTDAASVDLETAATHAANLLRQSQAPLICGIGNLTTQAQQTAWKIADQVGAVVDTTLRNADRASMFALHRTGKVAASLGEVTNRADLIVYLFCDPEQSHPCLVNRLQQSQTKKKVLVINDRPPRSLDYDQFIRINSEKFAAAMATLRAAVKGIQLDPGLDSSTTGVDWETWKGVNECFVAANYGALFYGQPDSDSEFNLITDSIVSLIRELNQHTRFVGLKLRHDANALSAENVLSWSCGFPFAVNHQMGHPRYNWLEYSAETVLQRRECDTVLMALGTDAEKVLSEMPTQIKVFLDSIPKIFVSPIVNLPGAVSIQTGIPGLDAVGEVCRFDDVSLPLAVAPGMTKSLNDTDAFLAIELALHAN